MLQAARRWLTSNATRFALAAAPRMAPGVLDRLGPLLAGCGPRLPVLARQVADNMRAAGVYSPEAHRAYFAELGRHFVGALHALRCGEHGRGPASGLLALAERQVELDESIARLREVTAAGQGAVLAGPHIVNYLVALARLNRVVRLTVYLRHSKHPHRRQAKQRWYRASGVEWVSEPATTTAPLGRLGRLAAAVRAGSVVFITPDLPQKRYRGTPVRLLDRGVYLPAGAAALAVRTGAPLFMLAAERMGNRQRLIVRGPCPVRIERGAARAAVERHLQWFADEFTRFVRTQPALWYLWGDKRWTRVFRGDRRYLAG